MSIEVINMNAKARQDIKRKLRVLNHAEKVATSQKPVDILGFLEPHFLNGGQNMKNFLELLK